MILTECELRYPTKFMQDLAVQMQNNALNKTFKYDIFDGKHTGICTILEVTYDVLFKEFDLVLKDVNTGNTLIIDRCHVYLKEITVPQ